MDRNIQLFEGLRIPRKIYTQFLSQLEDSELFRMGFEVEFYAEEMVSGSQVADLSEIGVYQAEEYFDPNDVNFDRLWEWASGNEEELLREEGHTRDEIENEIIEEWFSENPDWYQEYLEENGEWDDEEEEPIEDATEESVAKDAVEFEIRSGNKGWGRYEDFDSKVRERISEILENSDIAQAWWEQDRWEFIRENGWEVDSGSGYFLDENDEDIVREGGGDLDNVGDSLSNIVDEPVDVAYDYPHSSTEYWIVKTDSSLQELQGGVEVSSPVFPIMVGLSELNKIFDWMSDIDAVTSNETGLHVSLSFKDEKAFDEMDWVKIALLSGEEYMLKQFDRLHNSYTSSQLKNIEKMATAGKLGDLSDSRTFQDLKDKFAVGISSDKYSSFNIADYGSGGRVEWRIMGGRNYHLNFETVEQNVLKMAFAMYIGADENAFKDEYLRALGRMMSKIRAIQDDPLERKKQDLYGTDEEAAILRKNPFYSVAVQVLPNKSMLDKYKKLTIAGERLLGPDANEYDRIPFVDWTKMFCVDIKEMQKRNYLDLFAIRARLGPEQSAFGESRLTEAVSLDVRVQGAIKVLRGAMARYGYHAEDFKRSFNIPASTALAAHLPIADQVTDEIHNAYSIAAMIFPDMDEELKQRKMKFLNTLPRMLSIGSSAAFHLTEAMAHATKKNEAGYKKEVAGDLMYAVNFITYEHQENGKLNPDHVELVVDIMKLADMNIEEAIAYATDHESMAKFAALAFGERPDADPSEMRRVSQYASAMVPDVMSSDSMRIVLSKLVDDDPAQQIRGAQIAAVWISRIRDKIFVRDGIPQEALTATKNFIEELDLIGKWQKAGVFNMPLGDALNSVLRMLGP